MIRIQNYLQRIIIAIYVIAVLAFSGFAKADEVKIHSVKVFPNQKFLIIQGTYRQETCPFNSAEVILEKTKAIPTPSNAELANIKVQRLHSELEYKSFEKSKCLRIIDLLGAELEFAKILTFQSLELSPTIEELEIEVVNPENGLIQVQNFDISSSSSGSIHPDVAIEKLIGTLKFENGKYRLTTQNAVYTLNARFDLEAFIGKKVRVSGIEFKHQVGPALEFENQGPLQGSELFGAPSMMFVLGVMALE